MKTGFLVNKKLYKISKSVTLTVTEGVGEDAVYNFRQYLTSGKVSASSIKLNASEDINF